jgi:catechol 2,3-dioxygenase-like lactoylglutathione lyase family enzyme
MVRDLDEAVEFYTRQFHFELGQNASPAIGEVL